MSRSIFYKQHKYFVHLRQINSASNLLQSHRQILYSGLNKVDVHTGSQGNRKGRTFAVILLGQFL